SEVWHARKRQHAQRQYRMSWLGETFAVVAGVVVASAAALLCLFRRRTPRHANSSRSPADRTCPRTPAATPARDNDIVALTAARYVERFQSYSMGPDGGTRQVSTLGPLPGISLHSRADAPPYVGMPTDQELVAQRRDAGPLWKPRLSKDGSQCTSHSLPTPQHTGLLSIAQRFSLSQYSDAQDTKPAPSQHSCSSAGLPTQPSSSLAPAAAPRLWSRHPSCSSRHHRTPSSLSATSQPGGDVAPGPQGSPPPPWGPGHPLSPCRTQAGRGLLPSKHSDTSAALMLRPQPSCPAPSVPSVHHFGSFVMTGTSHGRPPMHVGTATLADVALFTAAALQHQHQGSSPVAEVQHGRISASMVPDRASSQGPQEEPSFGWLQRTRHSLGWLSMQGNGVPSQGTGRATSRAAALELNETRTWQQSLGAPGAMHALPHRATTSPIIASIQHALEGSFPSLPLPPPSPPAGSAPGSVKQAAGRRVGRHLRSSSHHASSPAARDPGLSLVPSSGQQAQGTWQSLLHSAASDQGSWGMWRSTTTSAVQPAPPASQCVPTDTRLLQVLQELGSVAASETSTPGRLHKGLAGEAGGGLATEQGGSSFNLLTAAQPSFPALETDPAGLQATVMGVGDSAQQQHRTTSHYPWVSPARSYPQLPAELQEQAAAAAETAPRSAPRPGPLNHSGSHPMHLQLPLVSATSSVTPGSPTQACTATRSVSRTSSAGQYRGPSPQPSNVAPSPARQSGLRLGLAKPLAVLLGGIVGRSSRLPRTSDPGTASQAVAASTQLTTPAGSAALGQPVQPHPMADGVSRSGLAASGVGKSRFTLEGLGRRSSVNSEPISPKRHGPQAAAADLAHSMHSTGPSSGLDCGQDDPAQSDLTSFSARRGPGLISSGLPRPSSLVHPLAAAPPTPPSRTGPHRNLSSRAPAAASGSALERLSFTVLGNMRTPSVIFSHNDVLVTGLPMDQLAASRGARRRVSAVQGHGDTPPGIRGSNITGAGSHLLHARPGPPLSPFASAQRHVSMPSPELLAYTTQLAAASLPSAEAPSLPQPSTLTLPPTPASTATVAAEQQQGQGWVQMQRSRGLATGKLTTLRTSIDQPFPGAVADAARLAQQRASAPGREQGSSHMASTHHTPSTPADARPLRPSATAGSHMAMGSARISSGPDLQLAAAAPSALHKHHHVTLPSPATTALSLPHPHTVDPDLVTAAGGRPCSPVHQGDTMPAAPPSSTQLQLPGASSCRMPSVPAAEPGPRQHTAPSAALARSPAPAMLPLSSAGSGVCRSTSMLPPPSPPHRVGLTLLAQPGASSALHPGALLPATPPRTASTAVTPAGPGPPAPPGITPLAEATPGLVRETSQPPSQLHPDAPQPQLPNSAPSHAAQLQTQTPRPASPASPQHQQPTPAQHSPTAPLFTPAQPPASLPPTGLGDHLPTAMPRLQLPDDFESEDEGLAGGGSDSDSEGEVVFRMDVAADGPPALLVATSLQAW
ncbi:hypothetical protein QJQ45_017826, partial [Haematococcus lacustris]